MTARRAADMPQTGQDRPNFVNANVDVARCEGWKHAGLSVREQTKSPLLGGKNQSEVLVRNRSVRICVKARLRRSTTTAVLSSTLCELHIAAARPCKLPAALHRLPLHGTGDAVLEDAAPFPTHELVSAVMVDLGSWGCTREQVEILG